MSEMVERVAKAIADSGKYPIWVRRDKMRDQWEVACFEDGSDASEVIYARFATVAPAIDECSRLVGLRRARAAIAAMREPTEAMCDAMPSFHLCRKSEAYQIWKAMIDEALK